MKKSGKHLNKGKENFETYFPTTTELISSAYAAARKQFASKRKGKALDKKKALYALKSKVFADTLAKKINEMSKQFPEIDKLNPFYIGLLGLIVDVQELKQKLSMLKSSSDIIRRIRLEGVSRQYAAKSEYELRKAQVEMEGRICSVVKRLEKTIIDLKIYSKKITEMPLIDFDAKTIVFAGNPNVGKSTLLKRLTGAKPEIAPYQFTTKAINLGSYEWNYEKIQILDTPGLLERENHNNIEKKALVALKHLAQIIVFVADPSETCGTKLIEQLKLFEKVSSEFSGRKFIVVLNKCDIATEKQISLAKKGFSGAEIIEDGEGFNGTEKLKKAIEKIFQKQAKTGIEK
jgi:nucleolar GTP-binding protein